MPSSHDQEQFVDVDFAIVVEDLENEAERLVELCTDVVASPEVVSQVVMKSNDPNAWFEKVKKKVEEKKGKGVIFLDLSLAGDGTEDQTGFRVAKKLRKHLPNAAIVLYSARGNLYSCFDHIAEGLFDGIIEKGKVLNFSLPAHDLLHRIRRALSQRQKRAPRVVEIKLDDNDASASDVSIETKALLSIVGQDTVGEMIGRCIPTARSARVSCISPGYSGALLLRANVDRHEADELHVILKMDRQQDRLERDLKHMNDLGNLPVRLVPNIQQQVVERSSEGWSAYCMPEVEGVMFEDRLNKAGAGQLIEDLFSALDNLYVNRGATMGLTDYDKISDGEVARILQGLDQIRVVAQSVACNSIEADFDALRGWLVSDKFFKGARSVIEANYRDLCTSKQHGDLHARNIIVREDGPLEPCLIDWARYGDYPWGYDMCKFETELRLNNVGSEDASEHSFDSINQWLKLDEIAHCDMSVILPQRIAASKSDWGAGIASIRRAAKTQIDNAPTSLDKTKLTSAYYYGLFSWYVRSLAWDNLAMPKRVWAAASATRLGQAHSEYCLG